MLRVQTRCSAQKFEFFIQISASMCTEILLQQLSILSILMDLPRKVNAAQALFLSCARLCVWSRPGALSVTQAKEFLLCFSTLYFMKRSRKIPLGTCFPPVKSTVGSSFFHSYHCLGFFCFISSRQELLGCFKKQLKWEEQRSDLHREGARHLHLWNGSRGELTDVNLLQMPNLLLALD